MKFRTNFKEPCFLRFLCHLHFISFHEAKIRFYVSYQSLWHNTDLELLRRPRPEDVVNAGLGILKVHIQEKRWKHSTMWRLSELNLQCCQHVYAVGILFCSCFKDRVSHSLSWLSSNQHCKWAWPWISDIPSLLSAGIIAKKVWKLLREISFELTIPS